MSRTPIAILAVMTTLISVSTVAHADQFGACAAQRDMQRKLAACHLALQATSIPNIRRWVLRELENGKRQLTEETTKEPRMLETRLTTDGN